MTEKQFEEYTEIKKEVDKLKEFLAWCGNKYNPHCNSYRAKIIGKKKTISIAARLLCSNIELQLSTKLQNAIIDVIEQYVEQREKDMEAI